MRLRVRVFPRPEILDPQGKAIANALRGIGFAGVADVRAGKTFELDLADGTGRETVVDMCDRLLANIVVEDYEIEWPEGAAP
jgi:phosphoribosylformylglycinamidine synthase